MEESTIFNISDSLSIKLEVAGATDIGGGKENQDDFLIYENVEHKITFIVLLDGHHKETGKLAANSAKTKLSEFITENLLSLQINPVETLKLAYIQAHESIKQNFKDWYIKEGYQVIESSDGFLLKRKNIYTPWSCVHGGSTCSIIAFVNNMMYISNVGDSSALLCSMNHQLNKNDVEYIVDCANPTKNINDIDLSVIDSNTLILTSNHSPESISEYNRIRNFRSSSTEPLKPALNFIYDKPKYPKFCCPRLFNIDGAGIPSLTNEGQYHKTVRGDFATYVTTPRSSPHEETLSVTRSLGDLQLQTYGISYLPEIKCIDLHKIIKKVTSPISIVLASDGVWDNWLYEDVTKFITQPYNIEKVFDGKNECQQITDEFMKLNKERATNNFGNSADNATCIIVYVR